MVLLIVSPTWSSDSPPRRWTLAMLPTEKEANDQDRKDTISVNSERLSFVGRTFSYPTRSAGLPETPSAAMPSGPDRGDGDTKGTLTLIRDGSKRAPLRAIITSTRSTIRRTSSRRWPKSASDHSRLGSGCRTIRCLPAPSTSAWSRSTSLSSRILIER